ncbi:helix-turn-helix transcriptional regulator [Rhodococcus ruber]|uniref:helix-turn-helix transcriptional regulator n=1 Tax=Rhodococcus ruber TaxID=1830 RepID=UPI0037848161
MPETICKHSPLAGPDELAEYLNVPKQTLAVWRMQGKGPKFLKLENGRVRYRWTAVAAWLDTQETTGGAA